MGRLVDIDDVASTVKDAIKDLPISHRDYKSILYSLDDIPAPKTEPPTLYGYDLDVLMLVVSIMKEKRISPEDAVDLFSNAQAMLTEIYREMADAQKKALEEICNRWEGGNEEWTISTM